ncbi:enoyl-CoA hydratase-related protein, partial [Saccharopolyspora sp. NPDC047091]|uniref:enoyl-CoA hydratase-related protein n=1 Tax=Saccharopolyspora sp. NPDC047091 TaxID=3155924 RepID=UPI0033D0811F
RVRWRRLPVPVIAAVHGVAYGGGLQLALGADLRLLAPDARLSVLEIKWGLVPDMTGTQVLPELVGRDVAKELTFTGRVVAAAESVRLGLATRVEADPVAAAHELAAEIAAKSPQAVRQAKRLLEAAGRVDLEQGFAAEQAALAALLGGPDQVEAVRAAFDGRTPRFHDARSGEGGSGDSRSGAARSGDSRSDGSGSGDALPGYSTSGEARLGDSGSGGPRPGDSGSGAARPGDS